MAQRVYIYIQTGKKAKRRKRVKCIQTIKRGEKIKFYRLSSNVNKEKKRKGGPKLNRWSERHPYYTVEMHFANTHTENCPAHTPVGRKWKSIGPESIDISLKKVEKLGESKTKLFFFFLQQKRYTQEGMTFDGRKIHHRNANSTPRPQKEEEVPCVPASVGYKT